MHPWLTESISVDEEKIVIFASLYILIFCHANVVASVIINVLSNEKNDKYIIYISFI